MGQINLLQPEFVINVGDMIEGYSDEKAELNAEWDEVDEMLKTLEMPFFRTPGNHDIANKTAQQVWRERHGATYYPSFTKKCCSWFSIVKTLPARLPRASRRNSPCTTGCRPRTRPKPRRCWPSSCPTNPSSPDSVSPSSSPRSKWIGSRRSLADHADVRWTFLFLHEPAWENPSESFKAIQGLLKDRDHTFFAGHLHYYDYDNIDGREHITMGPAGASFHHEGPGNVDHIMWVTMTDDGPQMGNIALKGIFDRKGLDPSLFGAYDRKGAEPAEKEEDK